MRTANLMSRQRGVVLIVVLIMLGIFSVIVVSMIGGSNINFKIAGNQQYRMEAKAAARQAIESYVSNPGNFSLPLPTGSSVIGSDFNGDGVVDMSGSVPPPNCLRSAPVMRAELNERNTADRDCFRTIQTVGGNIFSDTTGTASVLKSGCVKMTWDVAATVNDTVTGAQVEMHQGIYLRASEGTTCI
jgi:hypothetical protein